MPEKAPTALVSYSWDSEEHKNWVLHLANTLRTKGGVDAKIDRFLTQETTVNLNEMMVEGTRDNDNVIIVLTENYAKKAKQLRRRRRVRNDFNPAAIAAESWEVDFCYAPQRQLC